MPVMRPTRIRPTHRSEDPSDKDQFQLHYRAGARTLPRADSNLRRPQNNRTCEEKNSLTT